MVVPVVVLRTRGTRRRGENSARRSSAAITGCQLAKKSNARFPSLCDAMLMACRCLFSTRCLHTWLDPRGISEMFLAPIRNHILLLSSLHGRVSSPSLLLSLSLSFSSRYSISCSPFMNVYHQRRRHRQSHFRAFDSYTEREYLCEECESRVNYIRVSMKDINRSFFISQLHLMYSCISSKVTSTIFLSFYRASFRALHHC